MSSPTSESALNAFLLRQLEHWQSQPLNLIAAPPELNWAQLARHSQQTGYPLQVWTADWRSHTQAQAAGLTSFFVNDTPPATLPGCSLLFWPKIRAEGHWWLEQLRHQANHEIWLAGENQSGAKAIAKQLQQAGCQIDKLDSARHCVLYTLAPASLPPVLDQAEQACQWQGPDDLLLTSQVGVFSHNQVDEGSALLIETLSQHLPRLPTGQVLDLGCGYGLLGAWLLKQRPDLQLTACDVNGFALQATRNTLAANQLPGQVIAADIFKGVESHTPAKGFNLILSNPPFHTGKNTDYSLATRLISQAPAFLQPGGQLWLVANRFLPYAEQLQQAFGQFQVMAENNKFRVYLATR